MTTKDFFGKLLSRYLWLNIAAMIAVTVALCLGVKYGLDIYTHHGEVIKVPNVVGLDFATAKTMLERDGLNVVVSDSGYNRRKPADCILLQNPENGMEVKSGHVVYVTVNTSFSPTMPLPDIIDNSSSRQAAARLQAMGFKLLSPEFVTGEKDWVYGVKYRGRSLAKGDQVPSDASLTLVIGNGQYEEGDVDIDYSLPDDSTDNNEPDIDTFEEIKE